MQYRYLGIVVYCFQFEPFGSYPLFAPSSNSPFYNVLTLSPGFIARISRCFSTLYRESSCQDSVFLVWRAAAKPLSPVLVLSTALPDGPGSRCGGQRRCTGPQSPSFLPWSAPNHNPHRHRSSPSCLAWSSFSKFFCLYLHHNKHLERLLIGPC